MWIFKTKRGRLTLTLITVVTMSFGGAAMTGVDAKPPTVKPPHQFDSPVRMALGTGNNTLVVSDIKARQIQFLSLKTLASKSSIELAGRPSGVAQWKNEVIIANQDNGSVCVYSKTGVFSHCLGQGVGEFQQPNDLAVDYTGRHVFVLDTKAKRVMTYELVNGSPTGPHIGVGTLSQPTGLALAPFTGALYVSDFGDRTMTARVHIFQPDGSYSSIVGGKNRFSTPQGLYVDEENRVFLADAVSGEVGIFATSGTKLATLGGLGVEEGKLFYPLDVYVDEKSQDVYVADNRNSRIEVFRKGGVVQ